MPYAHVTQSGFLAEEGVQHYSRTAYRAVSCAVVGLRVTENLEFLFHDVT